MLYFSELQKQKVISDKGKDLGKVVDLYFNPLEIPTITKLVIEDGEKKVIPVKFVKRFEEIIVIKDEFQSESQTDGEFSVCSNLLDRQVIDLVGDKLVRVNDIIIADKPSIYLSGIDVSIWGVMRRLGVLNFIIRILNFLKIKYQINFLSWADVQNIELDQSQIKLKVREDKLRKIHPEDLADYLQNTNIANIHKFLKNLDKEKAVEIFAGLSLVHQRALITRFRPQTAAEFIDLLDPDDAVDVLLTINPQGMQEIMSYLSVNKQEEIKHLIKHSKTSMGELMTTDFLAVNSDRTAIEIMGELRQIADSFSNLHAVYVLNDNNQLVGVFSLYELITQKPNTPAYQFMVQNPVSVELTTPIEITLKKMLRYKFSALPVIDSRRKILGIVTIDDLSSYLLDIL
jgi:CBS domain-containing protein